MNEFYTQLTRQLQALTQDSPVLLSNLSNAAALLYQSIPRHQLGRLLSGPGPGAFAGPLRRQARLPAHPL